MTFSVQMPALGESVTEGTVTRWLKREGDPVEADEPLLEVSTDKVDTEIPSPVSGNLARIVVREDETVRVGAEIAVISESTDADVSPAPSEPAPRHSEPEPATAETSPSDRSPTSGDRVSVTMPALGESVTEGTVTRWLKGVGDHVETDEPLLEVSTDKVDTEIPSPASGTILEIIAAEDSTVPVGGELAVIGDKTVDHAAPWQPNQPQQSWQEPTPSVTRTASPTWNAPAPPLTDRHPAPDAWQPGPRPQVEPLPSVEAPVAESARPAPAVPPPPAQAAPSSAVAPPKADETSPYVTPLVRKLASEHGIDLSTVAGTGVGGRIRKQDVLAAIEEASQVETPPPVETPVAPAPISVGPAVEKPPLRGTTEKMPRLRQIVAQRTRESLLVSAQLTQVVEVDVTKIAKLRARAKAEFQRREGVKLTFLPFFARAVVEALKQHPKLNASINEETREITYHGSEHLGIAVDTERGLLTPVIHNAGDLNLAGLAHKIVDVADRTRNNKITPDELSGGTFTVTNLGSNGALFDTPIIVQPQVGILGIGMVVKRPVVATDENGDDTIAIRSMVFLPLTYDHRLVDGADAGRFLTTVKQRLEEGSFEAELGL